MPTDDHENGLKQLITGLLFLFALLFLTFSLLTHSASDPPHFHYFTGVRPSEVQNICGQFGALVSGYLFDFCGVGVWFILLGLALRLVSYFVAIVQTEKGLKNPILKTIGFFLILSAISGIAAVLFPHAETGSVYGCGGRLGSILQTSLETTLAPLGTLIFLMSIFLAGLVLACEWKLLRLLFVLTGIYALSDLVVHLFKRKKPDPVSLQEETKEPLSPSLAQEIPTPSPIPPQESPYSLAPIEEERSESSPIPLTQAPPEEPSVPLFEEETDNDAGDDEEVPSQVEPVREERPPYQLPSPDLLEVGEPMDEVEMERRSRATGELLERVFADYKFNVKVRDTLPGPILTMYEIAPEKGTRIAQIRNLEQDLAIRLRVPSVRIVAPIPGKNTIGVEVPHTKRQLVHLREVMDEGMEEVEDKGMAIPLFLGKNVQGKAMTADLAKLPHLLIAGRTGTGKSVCLNSIILSILMTRTPEEVRLLLIDPKIVEFTLYQTIPHLYYPVVTDMKKAEAILEWAVNKMEERYRLLGRAKVRQLSEYNQCSPEKLRARIRPESDEEWATIPKKLPSIVIIADEIGDLMAVAGKEVQTHIIRLAQKSRAVGIHLILATQKPTVDVITGLIKSNLPARIAFGVTNITDSRVVLDVRGAEQLLGNGDMLFLQPGTSSLIRGQGTFVSNEEVETIVSEISTDQPEFENELFNVGNEEEQPDRTAELLRRKDKLYNEAVEFLIQEGRGSTSILQRRFGIGYGRAARIIDTMAAEGVVGPYNGSQARDIIVTMEQWRQMQLAESSEPETPPFSNGAKPKPVSPPFSSSSSATKERVALGEEVAPKSSFSIAKEPLSDEYDELDEEYDDLGDDELDDDFEDDELDDEFEDEESFEDDSYEDDFEEEDESPADFSPREPSPPVNLREKAKQRRKRDIAEEQKTESPRQDASMPVIKSPRRRRRISRRHR